MLYRHRFNPLAPSIPDRFRGLFGVTAAASALPVLTDSRTCSFFSTDVYTGEP